jgi:hypothetical protein
MAILLLVEKAALLRESAAWALAAALVGALVSAGLLVRRRNRCHARGHGDDTAAPAGPLTAEQVARVRRMHATFAELDGFGFDERLGEFAAHPDPERELAAWERMACAYERFVADRELSLPERNEAFKITLLRSLSSERQVLRRQRLHFLSREDAIEIMRAM